MKRSIILGTDWWTDCDDAAAVRIVCRAAHAGIWNLCGVIINACMTYSADSLDAFLHLENINVPLGIDKNAADFGGNPPYQKHLAEKYGRGITNEICEDGVSLYRRLLTNADDLDMELIEIGYLQVLAALLESQPDNISSLSGYELVRRKVKKLWIMGGNWEKDGRGKENNFTRNNRAVCGAYTVIEKFPNEICFLGYEAGYPVIVGGKCAEDDVLKQVFIDHSSANGRSAWDPMLVRLSALSIATNAGYREIRGKACIDPQTGENSFIEMPTGRHTYVVKTKPDEYYAEDIDNILTGKYPLE
ncbi:MAG: nucleoside hydrolase [Eubacteriales bacterium]